jgi:hypothetical protein
LRLRPTSFDRNSSPVDPAEFLQSTLKGGEETLPGHRRAWAQETDGRQPGRLLRASRERPTCDRRPEQGDKRAPLHA